MPYKSLISEAKMSPVFLRKEAEKAQTLVGIEYEMVYEASVPDDEYIENDYDQDTEPVDIDSIVQFFGDNMNFSSTDERLLHSQLSDDFNTWLEEIKITDYWEENKHDLITRVANQKFLLRTDPRQSDMFSSEKEEKVAELIDDAMDDPAHPLYKLAYRYAYSTVIGSRANLDELEMEWVQSSFSSMQELEELYDLPWPYSTGQEADFPSMEDALEHIARELEDVLGVEIRYESSYHGIERHEVGDTHYILEVDGSVAEDDPYAIGIELVSYPMDLKTLRDHMGKIYRWSETTDVRTDMTCGLHTNVSIPGLDMTKFDSIKAAIFLGDNYVLEQFNREFSRYAKSALGIIEQSVHSLSANKVEILLDTVKQSIDDFSKEMRRYTYNGKFVTINPKQNHVEFRSMGDDWLSYNIDEILHVIYRYSAVLSIACDPKKYKEEYLTRIYKLLYPTLRRAYGAHDKLSLFIEYSMGAISKESFMRYLTSRRSS